MYSDFNIKNETKLGLLAKTYMDDGNLVPDEVTIKYAKSRSRQEMQMQTDLSLMDFQELNLRQKP